VRLMITGATGQVGWELARSVQPLGELITLDRQRCDLSQPQTLATIVSEPRPDIIVNAAAYTAVDRAEADEAGAETVNGTAVGALAAAAREAGALLVHYSTDYVFDGEKTAPYTEDDPFNPINAYGRSKLSGEHAIRTSGCDFLILRTSWVYAARGQNFLRTVLRLARERNELRIVADQLGAPTWARNIADATTHIVRQAAAERADGTFVSGVFHMTSSGSTSWHGFAALIIALAIREGLLAAEKAPRLHAIRTEDYPLPAPRPKNSRLSGERLQERFGLALPDWECGLALCLKERAESERPWR
jgi:dTDP-4-dehydrorhamnose reductase